MYDSIRITGAILLLTFCLNTWADGNQCGRGYLCPKDNHPTTVYGGSPRSTGGDAYSEGGDGGDGGHGGSAFIGSVNGGGASLSMSQALSPRAESKLEMNGPLVDDHSQYAYVEAVQVAPAFGTNCYESMNASLLDRGISIGAANVVCQSLQIADVWFALAAAEQDEEEAAKHYEEGLKVMKQVTRLTRRKLAWNNVKSFFQEVGVPVGLVALML